MSPCTGPRQTYHDNIYKCIDACNKLMEKRGGDYNAASIDIPDYFPFGVVSYSQMVILKALRLQSETEVTVRTLDQPTLKRQYERLQENLEDLINYARFQWAHLEALKHGQSSIEKNN